LSEISVNQPSTIDHLPSAQRLAETDFLEQRAAKAPISTTKLLANDNSCWPLHRCLCHRLQD